MMKIVVFLEGFPKWLTDGHSTTVNLIRIHTKAFKNTMILELF